MSLQHMLLNAIGASLEELIDSDTELVEDAIQQNRHNSGLVDRVEVFLEDVCHVMDTGGFAYGSTPTECANGKTQRRAEESPYR